MFLAAAVPAEPHQLVLDVGCGAGAAMLCLAARVPHSRVVGLEMQRDLVRLAGDNVILNGLEARVSVMIGDLLQPAAAALARAPSTMSWPTRRFIERGHARAAPRQPGKSAATIEGEADLADWVRFSLAMVRAKGTVTFIHRADRIDALLGQIAGRAGEVVVFPAMAGRRAGRRAASWFARASRSPLRRGSPPAWYLHDARRPANSAGGGGRVARGQRARSLIPVVAAGRESPFGIA